MKEQRYAPRRNAAAAHTLAAAPGQRQNTYRTIQPPGQLPIPKRTRRGRYRASYSGDSKTRYHFHKPRVFARSRLTDASWFRILGPAPNSPPDGGFHSKAIP